jgi:hypothetical protein
LQAFVIEPFSAAQPSRSAEMAEQDRILKTDGSIWHSLKVGDKVLLKK